MAPGSGRIAADEVRAIPYSDLVEQPSPIFVAAFVRSVAVLALEADAQIGWLEEKGLPLVDELALEFDDGFRLVPVFVERGLLNAKAAS